MTRAGSFVARIQESCLVLNGGWNTSVGEAMYPTTFAGFTRCDSPCTTAGTMVLGEAGLDADSEERATTLRFVGSNTVAWASTDQRVGRTTLQCGEELPGQ